MSSPAPLSALRLHRYRSYEEVPGERKKNVRDSSIERGFDQSRRESHRSNDEGDQRQGNFTQSTWENSLTGEKLLHALGRLPQRFPIQRCYYNQGQLE